VSAFRTTAPSDSCCRIQRGADANRRNAAPQTTRPKLTVDARLLSPMSRNDHMVAVKIALETGEAR
jgi:hypothetical protein